MKSISILAVSAALLAATANAGFGFGGCPAVTSIAYDANMQSSHGHQLLYADAQVLKYLGIIRNVASFIPDFRCFDLGAFGYDNAMYTEQFTNAQNAMRTNLLYFDTTTGTEAHYACMDAARAD